MPFPLTPDTLVAGAFASLTIILLAWIIRLEIRLRRLTQGKSAQSLEATIAAIVKNDREGREHRALLDALVEAIDERLSRAARGIATVRFNALTGDTSGRQSFATAILTERGDGVVISSMHARGGTHVYAKPLSSFVSEHDLSTEEVQAIAAARTRCEECA